MLKYTNLICREGEEDTLCIGCGYICGYIYCVVVVKRMLMSLLDFRGWVALVWGKIGIFGVFN